jgi:hypothetical protein
VTPVGETGKNFSMKAANLILLAAIVALAGWRAAAQTNLAPVIRTNQITAAENFREVNGKLYNSDRSVLWTNFQADCLRVSTKELLLSTFTMNPVYDVVATTKIVHRGIYDDIGEPRLVPEQVKVGDQKVSGKKIILQNYPPELFPAVGQVLNFRAMRIGTSSSYGDTLELWDYGTPHVVMVLTTNFPNRFK